MLIGALIGLAMGVIISVFAEKISNSRDWILPGAVAGTIAGQLWNNWKRIIMRYFLGGMAIYLFAVDSPERLLVHCLGIYSH